MAIDLLANLTLDQRRELHDRLVYEFRTTAPSFSEKEVELWAAILQALKLPRGQPLAPFLVRFGKQRYAVCVTIIEELLADALPPVTRRPVMRAVQQMLLRCLISNLTARGIAVTPTVLLSNFSRLRPVIDQAFPGYIEAKLLHRIAPMAA